MESEEIKSISMLQEQYSATCETFTETVNRLCETVEKVDKHKTIQTIAFLAFGIFAILAFTVIILLPIG